MSLLLFFLFFLSVLLTSFTLCLPVWQALWGDAPPEIQSMISTQSLPSGRAWADTAVCPTAEMALTLSATQEHGWHWQLPLSLTWSYLGLALHGEKKLFRELSCFVWEPRCGVAFYFVYDGGDLFVSIWYSSQFRVCSGCVDLFLLTLINVCYFSAFNNKRHLNHF